jgi:hypothetical protein
MGSQAEEHERGSLGHTVNQEQWLPVFLLPCFLALYPISPFPTVSAGHVAGLVSFLLNPRMPTTSQLFQLV